jgi:hypothetical protein
MPPRNRSQRAEIQVPPKRGYAEQSPCRSSSRTASGATC